MTPAETSIVRLSSSALIPGCADRRRRKSSKNLRRRGGGGPGFVGGRRENGCVTESPSAAAQRLLVQAADALLDAAGSSSDAELVALLGTCESVVRRLDRATVDAVAALDRRGVFAEHGYRSPVQALSDLLGWERFEARRRVVAAEQVTPRTGLDGAVLPARLPGTAEVFAAGARRRVGGGEEDFFANCDHLANLKEVVEDAPIVKFVNLLITQAIQDRASDIHLEPNEQSLVVRYRIDGVLHEVMKSPKNIQSGVISRLKIMSEMNIAERRVPQDGRLSVNHQGKKIDLHRLTRRRCGARKSSTARITPQRQDGAVRPGILADTHEIFAQSFIKPEPGYPGHWPDWFGLDDAVCDAQPDRASRGQRHHGRRPGRVPPSGDQPGANQRQGRPRFGCWRCGRFCAVTQTSS